MIGVAPNIAAMSRVEIYTTPLCPYCDAVRALLERKGIAYEEVDALDAGARTTMIQRSHGHRTVPQIFIDGRHVGGYDELAALERGGRLDPVLRGG